MSASSFLPVFVPLCICFRDRPAPPWAPHRPVRQHDPPFKQAHFLVRTYAPARLAPDRLMRPAYNRLRAFVCHYSSLSRLSLFPGTAVSPHLAFRQLPPALLASPSREIVKQHHSQILPFFSAHVTGALLHLFSPALSSAFRCPLNMAEGGLVGAVVRGARAGTPAAVRARFLAESPPEPSVN